MVKKKTQTNIFMCAVEPKLKGDLVFPKDPRYPAARSDLIQLYPSYPQVIVFVQDAIKDVRNAIAWAKYHNVSLRIRGARNSTAGPKFDLCTGWGSPFGSCLLSVFK